MQARDKSGEHDCSMLGIDLFWAIINEAISVLAHCLMSSRFATFAIERAQGATRYDCLSKPAFITEIWSTI